MSSRLRRTVLSFSTVLAAFLVYWLLVSPWIDPSLVLEYQQVTSAAELESIRQADAERLTKYARFFPPGSWELNEPIILESDGVELLMKDYENLSDGRIRLSQCTMLHLPQDFDSAAPGRVVILRAPEGAILQFDADLNLRRGKVGKLIGGELNGPVTIHGTPSKPGLDDELFIATRDVRMNERLVWADNLVEFRYGPNHGQGRDLRIELSPAAGPAKGRSPNIGGAESFQLTREVRMHLLPAAAGLFPGDKPTDTNVSASASPQAADRAGQQSPVDIHCQGPFRFDLVERIASFEDRVNVFRPLPQGQSDQMTCEHLRIYFSPKPNAGADKSPSNAAGPTTPTTAPLATSLQPERLEAFGNPVTIIAPSNEVHVLASEVKYDITPRRIFVAARPDERPVSLTWQQNKFSGRSLMVERPTENGLPIATASGAGWLEMAQPDDPTNVLCARWNKELLMRPDGHNHAVSLVGGADASFAEFGNLQADEIHLWLVELDRLAAAQKDLRDLRPPPARGKSASAEKRGQQSYPATPERMLAVRNVHFNSPQLAGATEHLEVAFDPLGTLKPTPAKSSAAGRPDGLNWLAGGAAQPAAARPNQGPSPQPLAPAAQQPANNAPAGIANPSPATTASNRRFELHGRRVQVKLRSLGEVTQLDDATLDGDVRLVETQTAQPGDKPTRIEGDRVEVRSAAVERETKVAVFGQPGYIAARGMEMVGQEIHLDRSRNEVWIPGAGRTVLPGTTAQRPAVAAPAARSSQLGSLDSLGGAPVAVDFRGGMRFDGTLARFQDDVVVSSESQSVPPGHTRAPETRRRTLRTQTVEVTLARPVDFAADPAQQQAAVDEIVCRGNLSMESVTSDQRGIVAVETLAARDLTIRQATGDIHALGPGTLESTRLSSTSPLGTRVAARPTAQPGAASDKPVYAKVDFHREITGNLHHQQIVLHEDIRGVYGPVARYGDKLEMDPDRVGPQGVTFRSDKLVVTQVGQQPQNATTELEAVGNTKVEGQAFTAMAHKLTYVDGKGQLFLEGQGHDAARLFYQPQTGGAQTTARAQKIIYWPETGQVHVDKAEFISAGQLGGSLPADNRKR